MDRRWGFCISVLLGLTVGIPAVTAQDVKKDAPPRSRADVDALLDGIPEQRPAEKPDANAASERSIVDLYVEARALESRRQTREAARVLEGALARKPNDAAILRALSRLNFALGEPDRALEYGERSLKIAPDDSGTIALLVALLVERRSDAIAAEKLLNSVLSNSKLPRFSSAALVAQRNLGDLYYEILDKPAQAADAYAVLIEGLDRPEALRFPDIDQKRILHEEPAESYLRFGDAQLRVKRFDLAARAFERGLSYDANHPALSLKKCEALLGQGNAAEALTQLEALLRRQPQGREPYELLARVLDALKRGDELLPKLEVAARHDPQNMSLQFAIVEYLRAAGRASDADNRLRSLLGRQTDPRVYGMLASTLVKDRKPRELIYLFREAMAKTRVIDSVLPQVEALVGDRAFGRELLEQAADMVRDDPTLLTSEMRDVLTFVARKVQAYGPLVRIDREALKKAATPENRLILYADLMQDQKYDEAADTLKQLFADSPEARTAPRVAALAESYFMDGQLELAFDAAKEAHRLDDADPSAHFLLALLLNRLGRGADALQEYQEFLKRHGDNEDLVIRAHAGMSSVYVDMNDYAKGEAELAELLQRNPDDAGINNDLGYLYAEQGKNLEQAEKMIRKALSEEPKNGSYLDSLGWVLYKKGKVSEAVDYLRQAAAEPSPQPTRLDHLGDALYRLGKYDEAEKVWKQAEQLAARPKPPDKRLDSIRKKLQELRQVRAETSKNHE